MRQGHIMALINESQDSHLKMQVKLLQKSLLQLSFCKDIDRIMLFKSMMKSLHIAQIALKNQQLKQSEVQHDH